MVYSRLHARKPPRLRKTLVSLQQFSWILPFLMFSAPSSKLKRMIMWTQRRYVALGREKHFYCRGENVMRM